MSAVAPSEDITPPSVPKPRSCRREAWALKIRSSHLLLRSIEVVGCVFGHLPGFVTTKNGIPVFTYKSFYTLYAFTLIILMTLLKVYAIAFPADILGSYDTQENVSQVAPFYLEILFFYLIVTFTIVRALPIKLAFLDIYDMMKYTPAPSFTKQFCSVFVWVFFICITIARYVSIALYTMSIPCSKFSFSTVATPLQEIFVKIYMTWVLEVYILISINLVERQQFLQSVMKEAITPQTEGSWDLLDIQLIEGAIEQHRRFGRLVSRFYEAMSPGLLVLVTSFFINEAFGLFTFLTNVVFIGGILEPIALIEGGFLLSHFFLIFTVCCLASSLSDQVSLKQEDYGCFSHKLENNAKMLMFTMHNHVKILFSSYGNIPQKFNHFFHNNIAMLFVFVKYTRIISLHMLENIQNCLFTHTASCRNNARPKNIYSRRFSELCD
ncbi:hypothetical protein SK128_024398 [Halocaridina rubra]|uniref:Gustatory receptor n=1 Tax=Halocaridina rubra TaxID=373956 RepID=A0AAN8WBE6_HALRR